MPAAVVDEENDHHSDEHKHHGHGPLIYDVYQDVNSLPLHAPFDKVEKERHQKMTHSSNKKARHVRQSINVLVGVAIGLCCFLVEFGSDTISEFRQKSISSQLSLMGSTSGSAAYVKHAVLASLIAILIYVGAAMAAAMFVVFEPRSSSSGIPQIIAFLNGVNQKGVLCAKVFVAKFFGTMLSFGSGLCLGPEGPMIHMGAMLGLLSVRRVLRPMLRCICGPSGRRMEEELSRSPLRYDIQAGAMGAGAGVAAAFQAPLAGTMFVVEEASSFFSVKLFFHTFVTCAFAVGACMAVKALAGKELYTYYHRNSSCDGATFSPRMILQVSIVAVVSTLLALAFNNLIVWCNTQRALQNRRLQTTGRGKWGLRFVRLFEVFAIAVVTSLLAIWLPASTPCQDASMQNILRGSNGCVNDDWMFQIMSGSIAQDGSRDHDFWDRLRGTQRVTNESKYFPSGGLFGVTYDPVQCPVAVQKNSSCNLTRMGYDIQKHLPADQPWRADYYCCDLHGLASGHVTSIEKPVAPLSMDTDAYVRGACPKNREEPNGVQIRQYSAGSSLWLVKPETVAKTLFTRGSPGLLPTSDLALFLVGYGTLTAVSAGIWVPGGLLVPQLVIGGTAGRLIGELWTAYFADIMNNHPRFPWVPQMKPVLSMLNITDATELNTPVAVADPGVFALAGAAAFLSASGSLALFAVVLLLEITYDWLMMPVIVLAVLVARTVTTILGAHGLYHRLIDVASLPYLNEHTHWRLSRWTANDILNEDLRHAKHTAATNHEQEPTAMQDILLAIKKNATASEVQDLLKCKISGNPKATPHGFPVIETDGVLCGLVTREALTRLLKGGQRLTSGDGDEPVAEENVRHMFSTASALTSHHNVPRRANSASSNDGENAIGVDEVMDTAPYVVQPSTPVHQIHTMFRQLGLRHVVVVDEKHRPWGMLTRKSLMPWRCPIQHGEHDSFAAIRHAREPSPAQEPFLTPGP